MNLASPSFSPSSQRHRCCASSICPSLVNSCSRPWVFKRCCAAHFNQPTVASAATLNEAFCPLGKATVMSIVTMAPGGCLSPSICQASWKFVNLGLVGQPGGPSKDAPSIFLEAVYYPSPNSPMQNQICVGCELIDFSFSALALRDCEFDPKEEATGQPFMSISRKPRRALPLQITKFGPTSIDH